MIITFRSHQQGYQSPTNISLAGPVFPPNAVTPSTGKVPTITLHIAIGIKIMSLLLCLGGLCGRT